MVEGRRSVTQDHIWNAFGDEVILLTMGAVQGTFNDLLPLFFVCLQLEGMIFACRASQYIHQMSFHPISP
jgi:hypothetical protein